MTNQPSSGKNAGRTLVLDIGGTHVKAYPPGRSSEKEIPSGPRMTPGRMVRGLRPLLADVPYDRLAIGYPGLVGDGRILRDPVHLAKGWMGFDFERAFGRPARIVNDAAMQALGSYRGGRMLFLGLGTGLGSAMVVQGVLQPMELAHLPWKKGKTFEEYVGEPAFLKFGRKKWTREVAEVVEALSSALEPDYVVLGGGNARRLKRLPPGARLGKNSDARIGGLRLWTVEEPAG